DVRHRPARQRGGVPARPPLRARRVAPAGARVLQRRERQARGLPHGGRRLGPISGARGLDIAAGAKAPADLALTRPHAPHLRTERAARPWGRKLGAVHETALVSPQPLHIAVEALPLTRASRG